MSNDLKSLRKQLRNVVQEILPELLKAEFTAVIQKQLTKEIEDRLKRIEQFIEGSLKETLQKDINERLSALQAQNREALIQIDERSVKVHDLMVRSLAHTPLTLPGTESK